MSDETTELAGGVIAVIVLAALALLCAHLGGAASLALLAAALVLGGAAALALLSLLMDVRAAVLRRLRGL